MTQVAVWAPALIADKVREICVRVAEPTQRGQDLRSVLAPQLERRRTTYSKYAGNLWKAELDFPRIGPSWSTIRRNIGGRIIGPDQTHIELNPDDAHELQDLLLRACDREIVSWLKDKEITCIVRDHTGVLISEPPSGLPKECIDISRPADDSEFAANEARIARSIIERAKDSRKPPFIDPSIIEFEGPWGFPSYCQIAHRQHEGRVQFAVIHMPNGGVSPTNMIESLATFLRHRFYSGLDPDLIDWFDVIPSTVYPGMGLRKLGVQVVVMQHTNGVYSHPVWCGYPQEPVGDWLAFIEETITRVQKLYENASHSEGKVD